MHFFTSICNNYLPKARVLARSVKRHCGNAKFTLILSDKIPGNFNIANEPFDEVITIDKLNIPVPNLNLWIYLHNVVELCTAVKGQALLNLLSNSEKVVYLDPDIVVFDSFDDIDKLLETYDIILTPHQTAPEKRYEDVISNEICSLQHGIYNFGFFAVRASENGKNFAKWFRDRLINFCYADIPRGLFTDQRWGDLVPAIFDGVLICKKPGCNVSTWNLTHRYVSQDANGIYYVNGERLKFYHFSGFDSGAQKAMLDRYSRGNSVLYKLREWYIQRLEEEGQKDFLSVKPFYNFYNDGTSISNHQRVLLRTRDDLKEVFAQSDPYDKESKGSYYNWYNNECIKMGINPEESEMSADELKRELYNIYNSRSWKLVILFKKIVKFFRK